MNNPPKITVQDIKKARKLHPSIGFTSLELKGFRNIISLYTKKQNAIRLAEGKILFSDNSQSLSPSEVVLFADTIIFNLQLQKREKRVSIGVIDLRKNK